MLSSQQNLSVLPACEHIRTHVKVARVFGMIPLGSTSENGPPRETSCSGFLQRVTPLQ
jgi:hypothetical protein